MIFLKSGTSNIPLIVCFAFTFILLMDLVFIHEFTNSANQLYIGIVPQLIIILFTGIAGLFMSLIDKM